MKRKKVKFEKKKRMTNSLPIERDNKTRDQLTEPSKSPTPTSITTHAAVSTSASTKRDNEMRQRTFSDCPSDQSSDHSNVMRSCVISFNRILVVAGSTFFFLRFEIFVRRTFGN